MIREEVILCGAQRTLVGVFTEPLTAVPDLRPTVVFLNAGYLHRPGPHRLHVLLARALAEQGYRSCRFDFSGIGDSEPRPDADEYSPERLAVEDTLEVLDDLARDKGIQRFVLFGICSGAYVAFFAACLDPRIVSIVPVNMPPELFTTDSGVLGRIERQSRIRRIVKELLPSPWHWLRLLRGLRGADRVRRQTSPATDWSPPDRIGTGPLGFDDGLDRLARKRTPMLLLFCRGEKGYDYLKAHRNTGLGPFVEIKYYPETDHTFSQQRFRDELMSELLDWLASKSQPLRGETS